nr:transglutaminase-like cysteine peptidase [Bradyrhizobium sp. 1]
MTRDHGSRVAGDDIGTDQRFFVETVAVYDHGGCCLQSGQEPQFCAGESVMHTIVAKLPLDSCPMILTIAEPVRIVVMRHIKWILAISMVICAEQTSATSQDDRVLPPMAFTLFCTRYPVECNPQAGTQQAVDRFDFAALWHQLNVVNTAVNTSITPTSATDAMDLNWQIFPQEGNCADYAVTKRHLLLNAGWASSALLLAEVVIRKTGEHHLVLIVKEDGDYLVLDNRRPAIIKLLQALRDYSIVRAQSDGTSRLWTRGLT